MRRLKSLAAGLLALMGPLSAHAEDIRGIVRDAKTKEEIIGGLIRLKEEPTLGTVTGTDGSFRLTVSTLPQTLVCSCVGYQTEEVLVQADGEVQVWLSEEERQLGEVVVSAEVRKTGEAGLLHSLKAASSMQSGVSALQIQKAQDRDASEVMKRVAGVSLQDDRFVMVRGLSQRYNNVWLNGSAAPSSEADSRAFSFDVVPSSQIDHMLVVKSPSPEYPADFGGGMILLETQSVPLRRRWELGASVGGNTQTTFSDYRYAKGSWSDFLGLDGGLRNLRNGIGTRLNALPTVPGAIDLLGNGLNNDWRQRSMKALPDMALSLSLGERLKLNPEGAVLGIVGTLNWSNAYKSFMDMDNNLFGVYDLTNDRSNYLRQSTDNQCNQKARLSTMLNLAYLSPQERTKVEWKTMLNQLGHVRLTTRQGISAQSNREESAEYYFSSRTTWNTQFAGKHRLPASELRWLAAYAFANRNMPDRRHYTLDDALETGKLQLTNGNEINREWTYLKEHTVSGTLDWKRTLSLASLRPTLKVGALADRRYREYTTRNFIYNWNYASNTLPAGFRLLPVEELMDEAYYGPSGLHLLEEVKMRNNYRGSSLTGAGYAAVTLPVECWEVHGGLRFEYHETRLFGNTRDYEPSERKTTYREQDLFPSLNVKYEISPLHQLRLAYGRSCNRPEFRELSSSVFYDFDLASDVQGNTDLQVCYIQNMEARYGYYPSGGEQVVGGVFCKFFDNPIEWTYTVTGGTDLVYSYENAKSALTYGVELDVRLDLGRIGLRNLTWTFNGALIRSRVSFPSGSNQRDRPMQGQSPYLINTGLYWQSEPLGLQVTALYNRIGKCIVGVGRNVGGTGGEETANVPDSYEMPRNLIDLSVSKALGAHWKMKLSLRDLLAERVRYKQIDEVRLPDGTEKEVHALTKSYRPGITLQLGASYTF